MIRPSVPVALAHALVAFATPLARAQTAAPTPVPAHPQCTIANDAVIETPDEGYTFGNVEIAAAQTSALVTFYEPWSGRFDGGTNAGSVWIDARFPRGVVHETHSNSAAGCANEAIVAATRHGGDLTRFTFGWMATNGDSGDPHFALTDRRHRQQTQTRWQTPRTLVADGRANLVLGASIGIENRCADPCTCSVEEHPTASIRTFAFSDRRAESSVIQRATMTDPSARPFSALAVAVGNDRQAIAFRRGEDLFVQRIDASGALAGTAILLAHGGVGAPAIAYRGQALIALWAQRDVATAPYTIRWVEWDPEAGAPPSARMARAAAEGDSMMAPAVAVDGDRVLLAWSEGDDGHRGVIRVGAGRGDLAGIIATASTVTTAGGNARDPEVALTASNAWLVWQNFTSAHPRGELRLGSLRCAP